MAFICSGEAANKRFNRSSEFIHEPQPAGSAGLIFFRFASRNFPRARPWPQHPPDLVPAQIGEQFFTGLSIEEAAEILGVSTPTAKRWWAFARAWLHKEIEDQKNGRA
jgi:hypothetical protein